MKIEGIGEHVGYVKPDTVRDYYGGVDMQLVDESEALDEFEEYDLSFDEENDPLTFFSGDDASLLSFRFTVHFFSGKYDWLNWEVAQIKGMFFKAGIFDSRYIHFHENWERITSASIVFDGDFNGGFAQLDNLVDAAKENNLPYEYSAVLVRNGEGEPTKGVINYKSDELSKLVLSVDELELLIKQGIVKFAEGLDVNIMTPDGIMTYREYRTEKPESVMKF